MEATQSYISRAREAIFIAQAILQTEELKFDEIVKFREALAHQKAQIRQEVAMRTKALEDVHTEVVQCLIVDEDVIRCQTTITAEEAHLKNLREIEERD